MQKLSTQPTPGNTYVSRTDDILDDSEIRAQRSGEHEYHDFFLGFADGICDSVTNIRKLVPWFPRSGLQVNRQNSEI